MKWPNKDPNEVLDYDLDWTYRLDGDTIAGSSSTFTVVTGTVVIDSQHNTTAVAKVWLSGGTDGETCEILNRVVTDGGRTMDQTVELKIKSR